MTETVKRVAEETAKAYDCTADVNIWQLYPVTINHKLEAEHVERLAKQHFGPAHFSQEGLPITAGEDFSLFLRERPGAFFALGTMKKGQRIMGLHETTYDYNDDLIASCAYFFVKIVEDRLGIDFEI